jgi:hypothetical protein
MVQRNGTREVCGTRLMMLRAWISKNVMPRKPGVSNDRVVIALRSNRAGAPQPALPGWPASIRIPSQRIAATIERVFEPGNAPHGGAGKVLGFRQARSHARQGARSAQTALPQRNWG